MLRRLWGKLPFTNAPCLPRIGEDTDPALAEAYLAHQQYNVGELLQQPLEEARVVVIDTETTGLHAYAGDEIIAIAMIELRGVEPTGEQYDRLINPQCPISEASSEIHGLDDADVADAPTLAQCLPEILTFLGGAIVVGHHVDFDMRFLNKHLEKSLDCPLQNPRLDTMLLYLEHSGRMGHYSLEEVAKACNITIRGRHTALGDAGACAEIFRSLASELVKPQDPARRLIRLQNSQNYP
jgi:DNA polymerase-3 subunit epsilon